MQPSGTALVTGASRGLGRAITLELARQGFGVVAGMRNPNDGAGLPDGVVGQRLDPPGRAHLDRRLARRFRDQRVWLGRDHAPGDPRATSYERRPLQHHVAVVARAGAGLLAASDRMPEASRDPDYAPMAQAMYDGRRGINDFITDADAAAAAIVAAILDDASELRRACHPLGRIMLQAR
jgi:hypothetical protein